MLTYADVCRSGAVERLRRGRMKTYADACLRMKTCADVCWRMHRSGAVERLRRGRGRGRHTYTDDRYSIYLLYWCKSTITGAKMTLYWYKSTNTDAKMTVLPREMPFTPVLSLQVLTLLALGTRFTCFLGTKVRILAQKAKCSCRCSSISTICCTDVC